MAETRYVWCKCLCGQPYSNALYSATEELVAKLQSEIDIENSMRDTESYSNNIKEYLENSSYEVRYRNRFIEAV